MWKRSYEIKSAIVREFEARKVPPTHPFWQDMASVYIDSTVLWHLRQVIELYQSNRSDLCDISRAYLSLARAFLHREIAFTPRELKVHREHLKRMPLDDTAQAVLASFGDPVALQIASKKIESGSKDVSPLEVLAVFRWLPSAIQEHLPSILDHAKKDDEWLSYVIYLVKLQRREVTQQIRSFLSSELSQFANLLTSRVHTLVSGFLLLGEPARESTEFHRILTQLSEIASDNIRRATQWDISASNNLAIIVYRCLSENRKEVVEKLLHKSDKDPIVVSRVMLQSYLSDRFSTNQWMNWIACADPMLQWMFFSLSPMVRWFSDKADTKRFDNWLGSCCREARKGIEKSHAARWRHPFLLGEMETHISAHHVLLQFMILTCRNMGVRRWLQRGVPAWDSDEGGVFFWELMYLLG